VRVVLTRREDVRAAGPADSTAFGSTRMDLQARVDLANAEDADLFLSIHSNGSTDGSQRGIEMWYDATRPFGDENQRLADTLQARVLAELTANGTPAQDRGIKDASCWRTRNDRCFSMFVIGNPRTTTREELLRRGAGPEILDLLEGRDSITTRATQMPGVLAELLFLSNNADAAILADDGARWAIARGLAAGLLEMLPHEPRVQRPANQP
jgi:N-acetylmuramoyl-L-alanine amidase